ncbi:unnamed protein product [Urochloa decumbens]|uniref:Uncharacterized protein n=1 Tax=Urochloa decumbens TaxID=240449 RepID=A0ABC9CVE0_9POAL
MPNTVACNLDDADLVGHIKSIIVWCQLHVSLLLPIRPTPTQSVDLLCLNVIHLLDSSLDLLLVCLEVNNEDQSVVIFDLLHCGFSGEGVLEDLVLIKLVPSRSTDSWVLGVPSLLQGLGAVKCHRRADLLGLLLGRPRLHSLGNLQGLGLGISLLGKSS